MAKEKDSEQMMVRFSPDLKAKWDEVTEARKISRQSATVALIEWFCNQEPLVQTMLLGQLPPDTDILRVIFARMRRPSRGMPSPVDMRLFRDVSVSVSKGDEGEVKIVAGQGVLTRVIVDLNDRLADNEIDITLWRRPTAPGEYNIETLLLRGSNDVVTVKTISKWLREAGYSVGVAGGGGESQNRVMDQLYDQHPSGTSSVVRESTRRMEERMNAGELGDSLPPATLKAARTKPPAGKRIPKK